MCRAGCRLTVSVDAMAAAGGCLSTVLRTSFMFLVYLMTSSLLRHDVEGISLAPVSWNMSNPIFKTSKNDHVIEVKLYDDIDFVCPFHSSDEQHHPLHHHHHVKNTSSLLPAESHHAEYYVIYMVSRSEYSDCNIYDESSAVMMLNCSNPRQRKRFTILFEPFQSIPNAPEYHLGGTYYFITTSTGSRHGISNLYQGACANRNMKLTVRVCCHTSTAAAATKTKPLQSPTETKPKYNVQHNNNAQQQYSSSTAADSATIQYRPLTTATSGESIYNAANARASHSARPTVPTRSIPRHRHTARPQHVKTSTHGKLPPVDDVNTVAKTIEDIASVKKAELNTNSAARASQRSYLCFLLTVKLFVTMNLHFTR